MTHHHPCALHPAAAVVDGDFPLLMTGAAGVEIDNSLMFICIGNLGRHLLVSSISLSLGLVAVSYTGSGHSTTVVSLAPGHAVCKFYMQDA